MRWLPALLLVACDVRFGAAATHTVEPEIERSGSWVEVETPPDWAQYGIRCWVWSSRDGAFDRDATYGGPVCFQSADNVPHPPELR